ncbi:MAG: bifunctional DNA-binding transcriptional regulator/O6-methylguanine-DNA methyltransferase Ada [Planctomycetota bacterium JB042]
MNTPPLPLSESDAWAAVVARDAAADGSFVYAVRTTGVYCRPGCPSRRPLRRNVVFHASAAVARATGFRPCRRCRPDEAFVAAAEPFVTRTIDLLEERLDEDCTLDALAAEVGRSPSHLARRFRERTGWTPRELQRAMRLARTRARVRAGEELTRAAYAAGFGSSRGLYDAARDGLGMPPGRAARGGEGVALATSTRPSTFGRVLVASTDRGVCAVLLGDDDAALEAELARAFPRAVRAAATDRHRELADAALRHLEDVRVPLALPLDLRGTPFQLRVWSALRAVPPGGTRTYAEVARAIGDPAAARAVARACAANVVAVLVPCHRIVRSDGRPGGYRWGAERKARLLERERGPER